MKKIIFISFLSLIFLAAGAQRSSKVRTNKDQNTDRKKSEITVDRSKNNKSRSYDARDNRSLNNRNSGSRIYNSGSDRPAGNRSISSTHDKREEKQRNGNTNRSINDKIFRDKTDLHKNIRNSRTKITDENRNVTPANSGRGHSINSRNFENERKTFQTPYRKRVYRKVTYVNRPRSIDYRRIHYPYRVPVNINIYWTSRMYREYVLIYPEFRYWYYPIGYRIRTASAYDAMYYIGEVVNIYGQVHDTWYSRQTDEYFLYIGAPYPYHDFSIIIPGRKARKFSHRPEFFFNGRFIWATGLVSLHNGKPEMVIMRKHQIHLY